MHINEFDKWKEHRNSEAINEKAKVIDLKKRLPGFELAKDANGKEIWNITKFGLSGIEATLGVVITNNAGIKIKVHSYGIQVYINRIPLTTLWKNSKDKPLVLKSKKGSNSTVVKVPVKITGKVLLKVLKSMVANVWNGKPYHMAIGGYVKPSVLGIKTKIDLGNIANKSGNVTLPIVGPTPIPGSQLIKDYVKNPGEDAIALAKEGVEAAKKWVNTDGKDLYNSAEKEVVAGAKVATEYGKKAATGIKNTANNVYNYWTK